jgi:hypothetical protein
MSHRALTAPSVAGYDPATFRERGVAAPFTAPALGGARVRTGLKEEIELLLHDPDGGQGVCVLPWEHVSAIGQPSIHDRRLHQHLRRLAEVTPASVRRAAQAVAQEGLAGRAVLAAARMAVDADRRAVDLLHERLVTGQRTDIEDLARIAEVFAPVGLLGQSPLPRVPALLGRLERMQSDVRTRALTQARDAPDVLHHCARAIADAAAQIVELATFTMRDAQALLGTLPALLRRFQADAERIGERAERPLWLLDGWEDILLLWEDAASPDRLEAALNEMAQLIPVLPREIREWVAAAAARSDRVIYRRSVPLNEDWRSGVSALLLSRNERLRARGS